jgi:DNA-binding transcriptional ArsR family regulator
MNIATAAACLESLGSRTRLKIFRELIKAGPEGLAVGDLQKRLQMPGSTLSHHLHHLVERKLVSQQRDGRILRCTASYQTMMRLLTYLTEECCVDAQISFKQDCC